MSRYGAGAAVQRQLVMQQEASTSIVRAVLAAGCLVASAVFAANAHVVGSDRVRGWNFISTSAEVSAYLKASAVLLVPAVLLFLVSCVLARSALSSTTRPAA